MTTAATKFRPQAVAPTRRWRGKCIGEERALAFDVTEPTPQRGCNEAEHSKRQSHEFDTKRAKCLISLETVQKFPLQQAQLRIRHGLSDVHRRQQVSLLAVDIGDA
jgi:hypothetical protein